MTREQRKVADAMSKGHRLLGMVSSSGKISYIWMTDGTLERGGVTLHRKVFNAMLANGLIEEATRERCCMGIRAEYRLTDGACRERR